MLSDQEARAWVLRKIASRESPDYVTRYTPKGGAKFESLDDHPRIREVIPNGPYAGKTSDAAGRYQFLSSTWDPIAARLKLTNFSKENQDTAAWYLADKTYRTNTGRDLLADARNQQVEWNSMADQWPTLAKAQNTPEKPRKDENGLGASTTAAPSLLGSVMPADNPLIAQLMPLLLLQSMLPQSKFTPVQYDPFAVEKAGRV